MVNHALQERTKLKPESYRSVAVAVAHSRLTNSSAIIDEAYEVGRVESPDLTKLDRRQDRPPPTVGVFNDPRAADTKLPADIGDGEEVSESIHMIVRTSKSEDPTGCVGKPW